MLKSLLFIIICLFISACSTSHHDDEKTKNWTAHQFYIEAKKSLNDADYETAIKLFESLEARYPFGPFAQQAQLEIAYAYYKFEEPDAAIAAADRFIKLHPRNKKVDYALYIKGLTNFERGSSLLDKYLPRDKTKRDATSAKQSFFDFSSLAQKFPQSVYTQDALHRMSYLRNNLAHYEYNVSDYYYRRKAYVASVSRVQYIITHYEGAAITPHALLLMAKAYDKLGKSVLAKDTRKIITYNYPDIEIKLENKRFFNRLFE